MSTKNLNFTNLLYSLECHHAHTCIYKGRDGWWGGGGGQGAGLFRVKSSDLANAYGEFNIGLEHRLSLNHPHPPPLHLHTHTHRYRKKLDNKPDND